MAFHLLTASESVDQTLDNIAWVANDPVMTVSGDDVTIEPEWRFINAAYVLGASVERARLVAPSLRGRYLPDLVPVDVGSEPASDPPVHDWRNYPLELRVRERLNIQAENDGAAAAENVHAALWMAPGPIQPVVPAGVMPIRWTGTVTSVANVFTAHDITLSQTLPTGLYAVLGARYQGATAALFRMLFTGQAYRPGGIAFDANSDVEPTIQRPGALGVWGTFRNDQTPRMEVLANTAAAQSPEGVLYVAKIGE